VKIIELKAENVKRLKAVEIVPKSNTVIISGRNGQGKTSCLDAIWLALGGGNAAKDSQTARPIRDGEKKATVSLDLDEIKVTRSWTDTGGMTLKVESKDGATYKSPQSLLDGMVGKLSFDPLAFSRMPPVEQKKTLLGLVDLGFDPNAMEIERKKIYDERTIVNRDLKALEARIESMPLHPDVPQEEVSMKDLWKQAQEANMQISANARLRDELERKRHMAATLKENMENLEKELEQKRSELTVIVLDGKELAAKVEALKDPDTESINAQLANVESTNAKVREAAARRELEKQASTLRSESEAKGTMLNELDDKKKSALQNAKFPVAGLGFDTDGVLFNDIPISQCSSAERIKVSLAIASALNPRIRVIRVNDGSLLDSQSMAEVERMAAEHDMQVWIERVDETGNVGIVIEDGEVKSNAETDAKEGTA
jgi:DNA repair exonuclease SbcCD ATPase subunit